MNAKEKKAQRSANAVARFIKKTCKGVTNTDSNVYEEDGEVSVNIRAYGTTTLDEDKAILAELAKRNIKAEVVILLPTDDFKTYSGEVGPSPKEIAEALEKVKAEIKAGMDNLPSNVVYDNEQNGTTYVQFNYEKMCFEFGGATNTGMLVDFTVDYDADISFDDNWSNAREKVHKHYEGDCNKPQD